MSSHSRMSQDSIPWVQGNLASGRLGEIVTLYPGSQQQLAENPVRDVAMGEPCSVHQAVQLWALADRHPLFKAVRTVSRSPAQGRFITSD